MSEAIPFYDMFPNCCRDGGSLEILLENSKVKSAKINRADRTMELSLAMSAPAAPVELSLIEQAIAKEFRLNQVAVQASFPKAKEEKKGHVSKVLMGHPPKKPPVITPMRELTLDTGRCVVEGQVFEVTTREIPRARAWVLTFDMTDLAGSVHVSRFLKDENAKAIAESVTDGMWLQVGGRLETDKFYSDIVLSPDYIVTIPPAESRKDKAEEKRVELHLHTTMSNMDALTNTKAAVKRAISWGHPAIAITDHGVVQSFPDARKAAGDKIKIRYGVEGYYLNDVDDKLAVFGPVTGSLQDGIVVFDIETTGLDSQKDRITEIGAVLLKNGEETARYQTFVNPERSIPANITALTGIRDSDVADAPSQEQAVRDFLAFVGDRPVAAHNAGFDVGFIYEACQRYGIEYEPAYVDTLALARSLMPELKNHKLDTVANKLSLPQFNHHRASDDAVTAGLILAKMQEYLEKAGVERTEDINPYLSNLRRQTALNKRFKPKHIIILAQNQAGIKNLYKIITASHLESFRRYPIVTKSLLMQHREGLIIGSACEAGEVFGLIADHRSRLEQRRLAEFYDYLEIQPICNNRFMLRGENPKAANEEELRDMNRRVVELGQELGKPVVATCDVHFLDPEDEVFRHVLLAAKEFSDADEELPIYFRTTDEMLEEFAYLGEEKAYEVVVTNTRKIADSCDVVRPLPPEILYPPKIEHSADQLKDLVYGRMHELYGENPPELITQRLETELSGILGRGYDVIYMSAQKLVADSLAHGYLVGSRGSVGSSLVAYMSGITEVNSLPSHYRCPNCRHTDFEAGKDYGCGADMPDALCPVCGSPYKKEGFSIPFETFLGFGGDKVPDIDLNFSGEYQANAHRYTNTLFGREHVFRAGTIGTVAEKTAFGYVKKYLERTGKTVSYAEMNRLAKGCVGVKRTTGQHPGGLVVIPQDMEITDFCPAQHPADDADSDIITTHFEYHCMEANLLKLDELGHDDPTMIRMLEDMTGVDAKEIPLDDPETMAIFKSPEPLKLERGDPIIGETGSIGIPEFGTSFTRQMLVDTQPEKFDTLVRLSGFSHGTDVWLGNAKDLILSGTADVNQTIGCRDDIMLYLISCGMPEKRSFKIMEAVRKGRGLPEGAEEEMSAAGVPDWYIESCKKIKYLFPKAHAVAYVMMAFRIAWFKVHKPLAFYSAYFYRRSEKGNFDAVMMCNGLERVRNKINEIKNNPDSTTKEDDLLTTLEACYEFYKRGFTFAPVDLYESDAKRFLPDWENNRLIPPFVAIGGLGESAALDIVEKRKDTVFVSVEEFSAACSKVSTAHVDQLRELGALRGMPETSQLNLFEF
ncbi:MAG: PolC-type DNA polymerase III [Oscillospiraceae bacterium]|nr:PolC-type DNA polymerase III [Oscillospiraceae bacterium]